MSLSVPVRTELRAQGAFIGRLNKSHVLVHASCHTSKVLLLLEDAKYSEEYVDDACRLLLV